MVAPRVDHNAAARRCESHSINGTSGSLLGKKALTGGIIKVPSGRADGTKGALHKRAVEARMGGRTRWHHESLGWP